MVEAPARTIEAPLVLAAPMTLPPAQRLGRYAVVRHLDSGGMGSVYVAYDEELHRRLAIKLLHPTGDDLLARERTLHEAQALARLSHPNIVQIYDIGEHDGRVFVAMEFIDGVTLRTWRETQAPGVDAVRQVYLQAGRGLAAVHAAGLCHRDFKANQRRPAPNAPQTPAGSQSHELGRFERVCVTRAGPSRPGAPRQLAKPWQRRRHPGRRRTWTPASPTLLRHNAGEGALVQRHR